MSETMSQLIQNGILQSAVTAIKPARFGRFSLVLAGTGPYFELFDHGHDDSLLFRRRVFSSQSIHGISVQAFEAANSSTSQRFNVLLWGGRWVRILHLQVVSSPDGSETSLSGDLAVSDALETSDWILDGQFASVSSCRAVAVTAHNVLLCLNYKLCLETHSFSLSTSELGSSLNSLLYSAHTCWISPNRVLIAAGTVFGEIVVWSYNLDTSSSHEPERKLHHIFTGHEGSIFGVQMSSEYAFPGCKRLRLLASCSDDRTIRIWDISDDTLLDRDFGDASGSSPVIRDTGFGSRADLTSKNCLTMTWAHSSRIWGVKFDPVPLRSLKTPSVLLVSRGEDATTQQWRIDIDALLSREEPKKSAMQAVQTQSYHMGKNIWSMDLGCKNGVEIFTGGADGAIISSRVSALISESGQSIESREFASILSSTISQDIPLIDTPTSKRPPTQKKRQDAIKGYTFITSDSILATTESGKILTGVITPSVSAAIDYPPKHGYTVSWDCIGYASRLVSYSVLSSLPARGLAFIGGASGEVYCYQHSTRTIRHVAQADRKIGAVISFSGSIEYGFLVCSITSSEALLHILSPDVDQNGRPTFPGLSHTIALSLPPSFVVTSMLYSVANNTVFLGSRNGALAVYLLSPEPEASSSCRHLLLRRHIHGSDAITAIVSLPDQTSSISDSFYFSTSGRDGKYAIHVYDPINHSLETLHASAPPFGPNIEGIVFTSSNSLILYGFRSKEFVVWNETSQTETLTVDCGGVHRNWAYHHFCSAPVLPSQVAGVSPKPKEGGTFMYTRANTFNFVHQLHPSHVVFRSSTHGREIKALAISPATPLRPFALMATGAEDTTIRLSTYTCLSSFASPTSLPASPGFRSLITIKAHTTGIQHLQFNSNGDYLFSCGGCEELYAWRIRSIPHWRNLVGVTCEGVCAVEAEDRDLRITGFDVLELPPNEEEQICLAANFSKGTTGKTFIIASALSNSCVRVHRYNKLTGFVLIGRGVYKTNCLTSLHFLPPPLSTTTATSGPPIRFLTSGTDGHVQFWSLPRCILSTSQLSMLDSPAVSPPLHQNSIKALLLKPLPCSTQQTSQNKWLVVTGGDDNALALTVVSFATDDRLPFVSKTVQVPNAHAASITAVSETESFVATWTSDSKSRFELGIASSGNDQCLHFWHVDLVTSSDVVVPDMYVRRVHSEWTAIADTAAMGVWEDGDNVGKRAKVLVVAGVGLQSWEIDPCLHEEEKEEEEEGVGEKKSLLTPGRA